MHYSQPQDFSRVQQVAERFGKHTLLASMEIMQEMMRRVQTTTKVRILVETAVVRLASLEELDRIEEWLNVLQSPQMRDFAKSGLVIAPGGVTPQAVSPEKKNDVAFSGVPGEEKVTPKDTRQDLAAIAADSSDSVVLSPVTHPTKPDFPAQTPEPSSNDIGFSTEISASPLDTHTASLEVEQQSRAPNEPAEQLVSEKQSVPGITVTDQNVSSVWEQVCQNLDDLTSSTLQSADAVAISEPNHLVVKFPSHYTFQKDACERPERRTKLEEELFRTTGHRFRVTFELLPETSQNPTVEQETGVKTIRQRRWEAEQHPMVQQAMETFGAEVVRVDHTRGQQ